MIGTCDVCRREGVEVRPPLHQAKRKHDVTEWVCVEDKPCYEAWVAQRNGKPKPVSL